VKTNKTKQNKAKTQYNMCWTPLFAISAYHRSSRDFDSRMWRSALATTCADLFRRFLKDLLDSCINKTDNDI